MTKRYFALIGLLIAMETNAEPYFLATAGRANAKLAVSSGTDSPAWQQKGFPHSEQNKTPAYSLGLGYSFNDSISLESRYVSHGLVKQKGDWMYADDGSLSPECPCHGTGSARVTGLTLAGVGRYHLTKNFSLGFEGGAIRWRAKWTEKMRFDGQDRNTDHQAVKASGIGAMTGFIIGYKQFDLRYEVFNMEPRDSNFNKQTVISAAWMGQF